MAKKKKIKLWVKMVIALVVICILGVSLFFVGRSFYIKEEYPLAYTPQIQMVAKQYGFDPVWLASIIRQESKFEPEAVSKSGAVGLMQLMPDTAKWICEMRGKKYEKDRLSDPSYNMDLGCWYLDYLMDMFGSDQDTVLAAYNAGQGQVKTWLKDSRYSSDGKSLHTIPFEETHGYVQGINQFYQKYQKYHNEELHA